MSFRTGFHKGKLGIGLATSMGMDDGTGNPRYPLDINGDIRLTGAIVDASGNPIEMMAQHEKGSTLWCANLTSPANQLSTCQAL